MISFEETAVFVILARAIRTAAWSGSPDCTAPDAISEAAGVKAGSEAAEASWYAGAGLATAAGCSIDLAGLDGGNGTNASFSLRDSGAAAIAAGLSDRASGVVAGLSAVAATLTGAGAVSFVSSRPPPNSLASKPGIRLRCVVSEADWLWSCPFANTLASCASGMRGQCRTLPVSMWTKGAPDVG